ncbi:unnamed protein product [Rhizoctonia solani]|uniref:Uncharacterized protein n=1 Tax=Rhizoctonia solani TaxID=456999 RepID=A0A8H3BIY4_9AGAM|nr:unnamed protein product [Rhizoctonia solani]
MSNNPTGPELNFCTTIVANPDILGIGIRISIYAGTILNLLQSVILSRGENKHAISDGYRDTVLTSAGLVMTAIITWKTQGLSLFDGLIVTMLAGMMTVCGAISICQMPTLGFTMNFSYLLFATFATYWGIQVWYNPATFGIPSNGENCTASIETIFVVLGFDVQVTNSKLRSLALFCYALAAMSIPVALIITILSVAYYASNGLEDSDSTSGDLKKSYWTKVIVPAIIALATIIYMIVTIEQMVHRNGIQAQLSTWTFGQTLALIMLLHQIMTFLSLCKQEF